MARKPTAKPTTKPAAKDATPASEPEWAISRIKGTPAALIGYVRAPDAETAIARAIATWHISPAQHGRLMARRRK